MKITKSFRHDSVQCFQFGSNPIREPKLYSHIYFVDGLLLDTGHRNMRKEVMSTVRDLPVSQIYITHHHEDHSANLGVLRDHFRCPTYSSWLCTQFMTAPPPISFAQWLSWGRADPDLQLIAEDRQLRTEHFLFEVIPIPGHAADMVALYERSKGWLFSSDLYVYHYIRYFMRAESMREQIASIKNILQLDFEVLFCSHNPQISGGKEKLLKKLQFFEDFYGQAASWYQKGYPAHRIFREMGLKENWQVRVLSQGNLSTMNMVRSVIRDEQRPQA